MVSHKLVVVMSYTVGKNYLLSLKNTFFRRKMLQSIVSYAYLCKEIWANRHASCVLGL